MMKKLKVKNAIFCEDIREEKSNKHILIGVFSGGVNVVKIPATIKVAVYAQIEIKGDVPKEIFIKFSGPGKGQAILKVEVVVDETESQKYVTIATSSFGVNIEKEGILRVEMGEAEDKLQLVLEKSVNLNPDSPTSAS